MAAGDYGYAVRVTDAVLGTTALFAPIDAKAMVTSFPGRYTVLDQIVEPPAPLEISPTSPTGGTITVTGSKGANDALTSLLSALVSLGLIVDATT